MARTLEELDREVQSLRAEVEGLKEQQPGVLSPAAQPPGSATAELPLWVTAAPEELAEATRQWGSEPRPGPVIPLEYLRREHLYEP